MTESRNGKSAASAESDRRRIAIPTLAALVFSLLVIVVYPMIRLIGGRQSGLLITFFLFFRLNACFLLFHVAGYWLYWLVGTTPAKTKAVNAIQRSEPQVAILIPIRDEPATIVRRMLYHIREIDYKNFSTFIIHNGTLPTEPQFSALLSEAASPTTLIRKDDLTGYKGGALNLALRALPQSTTYVLVLDVDHAPYPLILKSLVPVLEGNDRLAFVQAPQRHSNSTASLISAAYCFKSQVFYDRLCGGMAATGALFFSGTNALFRKAALDEISGFDETSLTEDIRTTVYLHECGWLGEYFADTVAMGYAPFDINSYYRQQRRWAIGTFQNGVHVLKKFLTRRGSLTAEQWLLYLGWSGTFYFQGVACNMMLLSSIAFLSGDFYRWMTFTDSTALTASLLTAILVAFSERKARRTSVASLLTSYIIFYGDFVVHVTALITFLLKRAFDFEVTDKTGKARNSLPWLHLCSHGVLGICVALAAIVALFSANVSAFRLIWPLLFSVQSLGMVAIILADNSRVCSSDVLDGRLP